MPLLIRYHLTMNLLQYGFLTFNLPLLSVDLFLQPYNILTDILDTPTLQILNAAESLCKSLAVNLHQSLHIILFIFNIVLQISESLLHPLSLQLQLHPFVFTVTLQNLFNLFLLWIPQTYRQLQHLLQIFLLLRKSTHKHV
jgi:hypothetical protein